MGIIVVNDCDIKRFQLYATPKKKKKSAIDRWRVGLWYNTYGADAHLHLGKYNNSKSPVFPSNWEKTTTTTHNFLFIYLTRKQLSLSLSFSLFLSLLFWYRLSLFFVVISYDWIKWTKKNLTLSLQQPYNCLYFSTFIHSRSERLEFIDDNLWWYWNILCELNANRK